MEHPAFVGAGESPGLEVWVIDKFEPVSVSKHMYGKFYDGDCYIVLRTSGSDSSSLSYDAHFWLGNAAPADKPGTAALLTVTLDDMLGGRAVHHREVMKHESPAFIACFPPAIRYLEGGTESGFTEVETNAGVEKRLLKLSGCENMRIEKVPAEAASLTRENCFILEVEHDIMVLIPASARATQRRKIIRVANALRDDYHNGRATIEIIDEFSSDEDVAAFFVALGSGSKVELGNIDDELDGGWTRENKAVHLYRADESGLIALSSPYSQSVLNSECVYVLDTPDAGIFVWVGRQADPSKKKEYINLVQGYIEDKQYPQWVNVTRVSDGNENAVFRQYFQRWDDEEVSVTEYETDLSGDRDAVRRHIGHSAAARQLISDDGAGDITVTKFAGDAEDVTETMMDKPVLYQSEAYVVKYQFAEDAHVVYVWCGAHCSTEDKLNALSVAEELGSDLGDKTILVRIPQGLETKHFLSIFKGCLLIFLGGKDNDYGPTNARVSYDDDSVRLFKIEGTTLGVDMRATQVGETTDSLFDDHVYVLETAQSVYVRNGKESDPVEQEAALAFAEKVVSDKPLEVTQQGEEPQEFWDALNGDAYASAGSSWQQQAHLRAAPPELSAVSVSLTGKVHIESSSVHYTQEDLSEDGVFIVDTGEVIYLWLGSSLPERVKVQRSNIIQKYLSDDGLGRSADSALIVSLHQRAEPPAFTKLFPAWDSDMWDNQQSYEDLKNQLQEGNTN